MIEPHDRLPELDASDPEVSGMTPPDPADAAHGDTVADGGSVVDGGMPSPTSDAQPGPPDVEPDGAVVEVRPETELDDGDAALLALVDRLTAILERSDLSELEVEAGQTGLVLRKPEALTSAANVALAPASADARGSGSGQGVPAAAPLPEGGDRPSVKAPLTGIWYSAPAPGSAPFVEVGREVAVGQVIGLIEAMKLFNEIKSDLAGRVIKVRAENGQLVKAKQPLIEVEPL
jgi:acetyl-CoA carboxylase biotin carboxyl carrier protein